MSLIILLLLGLFLFSSRDVYHAYCSEQWTACKAEILESGVVTSVDRNTRGTRYHPKVKYQYTVGSRIYVSEKISYNSPAYAYVSVDHLIEPFNVGDEIVIYYNPKNPARAVIHKGFGFHTLAMPITMLIAMAISYWTMH